MAVVGSIFPLVVALVHTAVMLGKYVPKPVPPGMSWLVYVSAKWTASVLLLPVGRGIQKDLSLGRCADAEKGVRDHVYW
jgi:hypothetical protein